MLVSDDGLYKKVISIREGYLVDIDDSYLGGNKPGDPFVAMYRTDGKPLDSTDSWIDNASYVGVAFNTPDDPYDSYRLRSVDERLIFDQAGGWYNGLASAMGGSLGNQINKSEKPKEIEDSEPPKKTSQDSEKTVEKPMNDDVHVITMPRLSDTMEEGTVASWFKKVGEEVEEGEILAEIETDKATMEFESFYSGTLLHIGLNEGDSAKVDSLLAIIGPSGTDISQYLNGSVKIESEDIQKEELKIEQKAESKVTEDKYYSVNILETV